VAGLERNIHVLLHHSLKKNCGACIAQVTWTAQMFTIGSEIFTTIHTIKFSFHFSL